MMRARTAVQESPRALRALAHCARSMVVPADVPAFLLSKLRGGAAGGDAPYDVAAAAAAAAAVDAAVSDALAAVCAHISGSASLAQTLVSGVGALLWGMLRRAGCPICAFVF